MVATESFLPKAILVLQLLAIRTGDALICACHNTNCQNSATCFTNGGACYSRRTLDSDWKEINRQKGCYPPMSTTPLCNISGEIDELWFAVGCCTEDYCNSNLVPFPNITKPSRSSSTRPTSSWTQGTLIDPDETNSPTSNGPTDESSTPEPTLPTVLICYKANTKKSFKHNFCTTYYGHCYHLIRRSQNGTVLSERHGCSEKCKVEDRNRAIRTCCDTMWCNKPSKSNQTIANASSSVLVSTAVPTTVTSSKTLSHSYVVLHSVQHSKVVSAFIHSSVVVSFTRSSTVTSEAQSSMSIPTTLQTNAPSHNVSSNAVVYITATVVLSIIYLIAIGVLVYFVWFILHKQKASSEVKTRSKKSTDTLVSISV